MPFKRQKSNVSPHYHDTRTLLRKYRDVMWNLEVSDLDLQEEFKAEYGLSTDALFVDSEVNKGGNRLENYARALERSKKMMQIIDTAIDLMRRKHKKGEFYYWILYYPIVKGFTVENRAFMCYNFTTALEDAWTSFFRKGVRYGKKSQRQRMRNGHLPKKGWIVLRKMLYQSRRPKRKILQDAARGKELAGRYAV